MLKKHVLLNLFDNLTELLAHLSQILQSNPSPQDHNNNCVNRLCNSKLSKVSATILHEHVFYFVVDYSFRVFSTDIRILFFEIKYNENKIYVHDEI